MNNDTTDEQARISQLYADNKAAFQAAQESAAKGDWQSFEKTPVVNDTPADAMKLKPCPFCGGEAQRFTISEDDEPMNAGGDVITCLKCQASSHVEFGRKENLVSCWNTRTTSLAAQDSWQPLSQDDAETELLSCLKNMKVAGDDKCLIDEMRWRGLWVYRKTGTRPSPPAQSQITPEWCLNMAKQEEGDIGAGLLAMDPAPSLAAQDSWTAKRVAELVEQGDGFWQSCSGCHETNDGAETGHYPFNPVFKTYQGAGCHECGGIGVVWDDTDYRHMAEFCLNADDPAPSLAAQDAFGKAADIVQSRYDKAPWNKMGEQFAAAISDLRALASSPAPSLAAQDGLVELVRDALATSVRCTLSQDWLRRAEAALASIEVKS